MFEYDDWCPGGEGGDGGEDYSSETGAETGTETAGDKGGETAGAEAAGEKNGGASADDGREGHGAKDGVGFGAKDGAGSGAKDGEGEPSGGGSGGKSGEGDKTTSGKMDLTGGKLDLTGSKLDLTGSKTEAGAKTESGEKTEVSAMKFGAENEKSEYAPQSRVKVDGVYYRTDDNGKVHMYRDNEDKTYKLIPDNEYTSKGYDYKTDDKGRIVEAHGTLRISDTERGSMNAKVEDMQKGDERGHIVSAKNDGSDRIDNLVPMSKELNDGQYKSFEASLNKMAEKNDVEVTYTPIYNEGNNSKRPDSLAVSYTLTDKETGEKSETYYRIFDNPPTTSKEDE